MNAKQAQFVREYLIDLNATQAAKRAGYSDATAYSQGQRLLKDAEVAAELEKAMSKRADRTDITADRVLEELWAIATADPNELIQFRRGACPDCWGEPDGEPDVEMEEQAHGGALMRVRQDEPPPHDHTQEPRPDCPACGGEGQGRAFVADTRKLSGAARKLYAGVKISRSGIEVKMHDKAAALVNVGRHLGMFTDKVEHSGAVGISPEMMAWLDKRGQ